VILTDEKDLAYQKPNSSYYASILNKHLKDDETSKQLFDDVDLEIDHHKHKPNQVAKSFKRLQ
jgi:putative membrane protein